jgi:hypothetical protein
MLAPPTAALVRAVLEKTALSQAILVVWPDPREALVALHCEDFSADFASGRLWPACGEQWPADLASILESNPGLCVPRQFIRSGIQDDAVVSALISQANPVLANETGRRAERMNEIRRRPKARSGRQSTKICVVAGSAFSLSDPSGTALAKIFAAPGDRWARLDISRATSASPLALAAAAADCDAVITANLYRGEVGGAVPDDLPWITWATNPRIASPSCGALDVVLVADEHWRKRATAAGWPPNRVRVAAWPALGDDQPPAPAAPLAMIADAPMIDPPARLNDFSSHAVLWEQIAAELTRDPFAVGDNIDAFLSSRIHRLEIDAHALDRDLFAAKLILPAWRRAVVRLLVAAGLPLAVHGSGWDDPEFASFWHGPVTSIDELRRAAASSAALIHPDPSACAHPIAALGRPVVRPTRLLKDAANALAGRLSIDRAAPPLTADAVLSILR